jgi:hypothetical protein
MITVLHGDNLVLSRNRLQALIKQQKLKTQPEIIRLEAATTPLDEFIQAFESGSLFDLERLIVIENLFSLPPSNEKNSKINYLFSQANQPIQCFIWEPKKLNPSTLTKINRLQIKALLFKTPAIVFKFLDAVQPKQQTQVLNLFREAVKKNSAEMIFYLLCRRLSQLIQALDQPASLKGAVWQIAKIKTQARSFRLSQLLQLHRQLLKIDRDLKTGKNLLPLASQLDLFLLEL